CVPLHLHSFPTRRSSDLFRLGGIGMNQAPQILSQNRRQQFYALVKSLAKDALLLVQFPTHARMLRPTARKHKHYRAISHVSYSRSEEHTSELQSQSNLVC